MAYIWIFFLLFFSNFFKNDIFFFISLWRLYGQKGAAREEKKIATMHAQMNLRDTLRSPTKSDPVRLGKVNTRCTSRSFFVSKKYFLNISVNFLYFCDFATNIKRERERERKRRTKNPSNASFKCPHAPPMRLETGERGMCALCEGILGIERASNDALSRQIVPIRPFQPPSSLPSSPSAHSPIEFPICVCGILHVTLCFLSTTNITNRKRKNDLYYNS